VRELAADGIPVAVSSRVLKLSRQPYYRWLAAPVPEAEVNEAYRANALFDAHRDNPEFGYRYLADEAEAAGEPMAARTAWRLCSANAWFSVFGKARAKNGKRPGPPVHDDLCAVVDADGRVRHEFHATAVNELWITDITEHRTDEGKLYMCAIKDVYSSRIVGYSIGARMKARLAVDALEMAVARRGRDAAGCVTHSDRGSPIPVEEIHPRTGAPRPDRIDGQSRRGRRQRCHGIVFRSGAEERSRPSPVGESRAVEARDRDVD
jgi:putative transposase